MRLVRVRVLRLSGASTVVALLVAVGCSREAVSPYSPRANLVGDGFPVRPSRLLATWQLGGSGSGTFVGSPPVGAVECLTHGAVQFSFGVPFPQALEGTTFVGCDTLLASPGRVVYNSDNSPKFTGFSTEYTNGISEQFGDWLMSTNANLVYVGTGGGGGQYECWVVQDVKEIPFHAHGIQKSCNPHRPQDLSGFVLDSVALDIESFQLTTEPYAGDVMWAHLSVQRTWSFYGHRAEPALP